mgnify:CR=1 FL=1
MRRDHYREPSVFAHVVQAEFPRNPMKRCAPLVYPPYDRPSADRLHQRGDDFEGCSASSSPSSLIVFYYFTEDSEAGGEGVGRTMIVRVGLRLGNRVARTDEY